MDIWVKTNPANMDETIREYTSRGWSYEGSNGHDEVLFKNGANAEDFGIEDYCGGENRE